MNFIQKSLVTVLGKFLGAFLSLITSVILARTLGVAGVGQYQLMISTQTIAITFAAMGFGNATIYFINHLKIDKKIIVSNTFKFYLYVSIFFFFIFIVLILFNKEYFGDYSIVSVILFSLGSAALLLYNILLPILYVDLEVVKVQILSMLSSFIVVVGLSLFYFINELDINSVLILVGSTNIVSLIFLICFLHKDLQLTLKLDFSIIKKIFIYGIKISATNLVFILSSNIVIFLLKKFSISGFDEIGLYSRAIAIVSIFVMIPSSIGPLIYSKWAGVDLITLKQQVQKTIRFLFLISFLCLLFIILYGDSVIVLLYGKEFINAKTSLLILSSSVIFTSITSVLINLFSSIGKPLIILRTFSVSLIITLIISLVLIPEYGIEGASIAVLVGLIYNSINLLRKSKKEISLNYLDTLIIKYEDIKDLQSIFLRKK